MEVIFGEVGICDVDAFLGQLREIGERSGSAVQAIDARYVTGADQLEAAVTLARRARERGEAIADDPALDILLYAAGTRQIDRALTIGVSEDTDVTAIVIDGGGEEAAAAAIRDSVVAEETGPDPDPEAITEWFDITEAERDVTDASLGDLVRERVALLTVER